MPFPALPQARSRHAWGATPRPCGTQEGEARAATHRRLGPRLIERIVHVRAGGFAVPFPALPKARGRHAWGATPRPCGTQEGGMARAATHRRRICCDLRRSAAGAESRVRTVSRCFLPRKRANASITARAALRPVPRRESAGTAPKLSFKKAWDHRSRYFRTRRSCFCLRRYNRIRMM